MEIFPQSPTEASSAWKDNAQLSSVSDSNPHCTELEQGCETLEPGEPVPSFLPHSDGKEEETHGLNGRHGVSDTGSVCIESVKIDGKTTLGDHDTPSPSGSAVHPDENEPTACTESHIESHGTLQDTDSYIPLPNYTEPEQGVCNNSKPGNHDVSPSVGFPAHADDYKELAITNIKATNLTLGLRRIPVGFYVAVQHSGLEWRTENKRSSVSNDVIDWDGPIPLPSDLITDVHLEVYASFEFQPMLGNGELLRRLTTTVKYLLDCSAGDLPFTFFPKDEDVASPCSSLQVSARWWKCQISDPSVSRFLEPYRLTGESRAPLEIATDDGHAALLRYQKNGNKEDLERSIKHFEKALDDCSTGDLCRGAAQSNLAMAKFILCRVEESCLDAPFRLYSNVLSVRPVGHIDRSMTLIHLASVHIAQFEKKGSESDVTQAKALLCEAMDLFPKDTYGNKAASMMLHLLPEHRVSPAQPFDESMMPEGHYRPNPSNGDLWTSSVELLELYERLGNLNDLQQSIAHLETLMVTSLWDTRYPGVLSNYGVALLIRFDHLGDIDDIERAITSLGEAVRLTPEGHLDKPARLNNLGRSFISRFWRVGELSDLEQAISRHGDAALLIANDHPDKPTVLNNLGNSLFTRFQHLGKLIDLERAISTYSDAVRMTPDGHPDKPIRLSNLGSAFLTRFQHLGEFSDLEQAISRHSDADQLIASDHPDKPALLNNLGTSFFICFARLSELSDLEQAISRQNDAVQLTPNNHPDKSTRLSNLGNSFITCFKHLGELSDLWQAISKHNDAVQLTPDGHPKKPSQLNNLGSSFITRFEHLGELGDLEQAILVYGDAVRLTPDGHPGKSGWLTNLGGSFLARFKHLGELSDLEWAILRHSDAVLQTPDDHPDKPALLNNLGNSFVVRFERLGKLSDLEQAISVHNDAVQLITDGHPNKPALLSSLGVSYRTRFEHLGMSGDLEQAISRLSDAVRLTSDGHPDKPHILNSLGNSFFTRFECLGEFSDLEQAISRYKEAVWLTPDGHPDKPGRLNNLGSSLRTRFDRLGDLSDLEQAILEHSTAVQLTPDDHPDKPARLSNLGSSMVTRFERLGELSDLEQAISRQSDAVRLTPDGHPGKPGRLNNLGSSFRIRFECLGELSDLEQAISRHSDAIQLTPDSHPDKPAFLNCLGGSFITRFKRLGELSDLEYAILRHNDAVQLTPNGHPGKPIRLNNLGSSFVTRFKRLGDLSDLEQAISKHSNAVLLTPEGHPDKPTRLNNLGNSFLARFKHLGELVDLNQAILRHSDAVQLTPDGHPDKPAWLNNLGRSFIARFERLGELSDLELAISKLSDAVQLTPDSHPGKPAWLNNLGSSFVTRYKRLGDLGDLEQAILWQSDAVRLTPDGHPDKSGRLNNLGISFRTRFDRLSELGDLKRAISKQSDAVQLAPDGHPDKPALLNGLGSSLRTRFDCIGEISDLEWAILRHGDAVWLIPDRHPDKPLLLNNLGNSSFARFLHLSKLGDLERAILSYSDAVQLTSDSHPDKPAQLNNLGNSFLARFKHLGELSDLERAISSHSDAIRLTPSGHPDKPIRLNSLGNSLVTRFEHLGELGDLDQAISSHSDAVRLTPDDHPDKSVWLTNLGGSFVTRFDRFGELGDLEHAILLYSMSASFSIGSPTSRFRTSLLWVACARAAEHHSLLHAYSVAIGLLPQLAWIGLSFPHRIRELVRGAGVVRDAAAAALDAGLPEVAVEWLEQGRSIVWGELFQLRSSYDDLFEVYPDHAHKLRQLSNKLEEAGAVREQSSRLVMAPVDAQGKSESSDRVANIHRTLAIERDELLLEIRKLPGFERFLLHKGYSRLRLAARSGPAVILNATETRCDALVVLADVQNVIHVPLPNFPLAHSGALQAFMKGLIRNADAIPFGEREGKDRYRQRDSEWEPILSSLWKCVVKPVLDSLAFVAPGGQSRIFWCPTGPLSFLPIHAAGYYHSEYSQPGHKIFDFVVSSYIPTLGILASSLESQPTVGDTLRLLAVRQPLSDGHPHLPGVDDELRCIREIIESNPSTCVNLSESSSGTVEEVLGLMKEADWIHFACHGVQDSVNPTETGLCLAHKRRLRLSDIIALSRPRGGLAFLSACQTAKGDQELSDEAMHIAAGMLFAGYGGVVGTMWSISDELAPEVAKSVYEQLLSTGTGPDYRDAAQALQNAIARLRNKGTRFLDWIPFIHVGL